MAVVIPSCAGSPGRSIPILVPDGVAPLTFSIDGDTLDLGVATRIEATQQVAAQFQPSLNSAIFVTPFGDQPGRCAVSFVANRECLDPSSNDIRVIEYYLANRILPDNNKTPLIITIGVSTFRGYTTAMSFSSQAPAGGSPLVQGTILFTAWPT